MKFFILLTFLSANCFSFLKGNENPEYKYIYLNYKNQKIEQYFLVVGLEKNKIKFEEVDSKAILGLEQYLNFKKNEDGVFLLKSTPFCLMDLSEGKNINYSFESEYGDCHKNSILTKNGSMAFIFWLKKIYFTYRDFVDWL